MRSLFERLGSCFIWFQYKLNQIGSRIIVVEISHEIVAVLQYVNQGTVSSEIIDEQDDKEMEFGIGGSSSQLDQENIYTFVRFLN